MKTGHPDDRSVSLPSGWIGVDLDGTLAFYDSWKSPDHIGEPIPLMADRVRKWLEQGREVRIFTARVDGGEAALSMGEPAGEKFRDIERVRSIIQDWTEKHFGVRLPVTNQKDFGTIELWDDRCVQVQPNTGQTILETCSMTSPTDTPAFTQPEDIGEGTLGTDTSSPADTPAQLPDGFEAYWAVACKEPPYSNAKGIAKHAWDAAHQSLTDQLTAKSLECDEWKKDRFRQFTHAELQKILKEEAKAEVRALRSPKAGLLAGDLAISTNPRYARWIFVRHIDDENWTTCAQMTQETWDMLQHIITAKAALEGSNPDPSYGTSQTGSGRA